MTDKEKEAIEYWKRELNRYEYTKDLDLASDNYFGQFEEKINMISGILNLIENQQAKIKEIKKQKHNQSSLRRLNERKMRKYRTENKGLKAEIEKKDKIIELMSEQLTTPIHSKEWVIEYYTKKVEQK